MRSQRIPFTKCSHSSSDYHLITTRLLHQHSLFTIRKIQINPVPNLAHYSSPNELKANTILRHIKCASRTVPWKTPPNIFRQLLKLIYKTRAHKVTLHPASCSYCCCSFGNQSSIHPTIYNQIPYFEVNKTLVTPSCCRRRSLPRSPSGTLGCYIAAAQPVLFHPSWPINRDALEQSSEKVIKLSNTL